MSRVADLEEFLDAILDWSWVTTDGYDDTAVCMYCWAEWQPGKQKYRDRPATPEWADHAADCPYLLALSLKQ